MTIARSTVYAEPSPADDGTSIVEAMSRTCDEFESYGWRRVRAALRQQGLVVNHKKICRLMREHDLQPRVRRRHTTTTDSDHDQPIFPNLARTLAPDGPNQLWVSDITYVPIIGGFVYVAIILDAWSRRVVGYAISRSIDVRLTLAALDAAVADRNSSPGCVHHSDRGSQCGLNRSSQHSDEGGYDGREEATIGSMRTAAVAVTRSAAGVDAERAAAILDFYCDWDEQRGGCDPG